SFCCRRFFCDLRADAARQPARLLRQSLPRQRRLSALREVEQAGLRETRPLDVADRLWSRKKQNVDLLFSTQLEKRKPVGSFRLRCPLRRQDEGAQSCVQSIRDALPQREAVADTRHERRRRQLASFHFHERLLPCRGVDAVSARSGGSYRSAGRKGRARNLPRRELRALRTRHPTARRAQPQRRQLRSNFFSRSLSAAKSVRRHWSYKRKR